MTTEQLAIILSLCGIVLILIGLLWLYVLAQHQEDWLKKQKEENKKAEDLLKAVLCSPSAAAREAEMKQIEETADSSNGMLLCLVSVFARWEEGRNKLSGERRQILDDALKHFEPVPKLLHAMKYEDNNTRAYICRCLGYLRAEEAIADLRECLTSKHRTIRYNAGMALSMIGDEEGVLSFLVQNEKNRDYSDRIFRELMDNYSGDKASLIRRYLENAPDESMPQRDPDRYEQMCVMLIQAVRNDRLVPLKDLYVEGFLGKLPPLRLACMKAISALGTPDLKKYFLLAARDNDWLIRLASIPGLEKTGDVESVETLARLTSDEQWWVRRRAAEALVRTDEDMQYVEKIFQGYDLFAADAVKEVLYKM